MAGHRKKRSGVIITNTQSSKDRYGHREVRNMYSKSARQDTGISQYDKIRNRLSNAIRSGLGGLALTQMQDPYHFF